MMAKMQRASGKAACCIAAAMAACVLLASCGDSLDNDDAANGGLDFSDYASTRYRDSNAEASDEDQSHWGAVNAHDTKLFYDDASGWWYVYVSDTSKGNIEKVGGIIRKSRDLVNWRVLPDSAFQGYWDTDLIAWTGMDASSDKDTLHTNPDYSAVIWAPTLLHHPVTGLYYMYYGVNCDIYKMTAFEKNNRTKDDMTGTVASAIGLAIATSPEGPFYPANFISSFDPATTFYKPASSTPIPQRDRRDIMKIQRVLQSFNIEYTQSFLVRYTGRNSDAAAGGQQIKGTIDRQPVYLQDDDPDNPAFKYNQYNNNYRFGCIDPEFVFDFSVSGTEPYSKVIGGHKCYAMNYGSWKSGICVMYVDALTLKPVDQSSGVIMQVKGKDVPMDVYAGNKKDTKNANGTFGTAVIGNTTPGKDGQQSTAYEGAQVFGYGGQWYIITSMGNLDWEYRSGVFRAPAITGAYVDTKQSAKPGILADADRGSYHGWGGKIIGAYQYGAGRGDRYGFRGQGGLSVMKDPNTGKMFFACHARPNFQQGYYMHLQVFEMKFVDDAGGAGLWPVLNQNEYMPGLSEEPLTMKDIAGTYDAVLTETECNKTVNLQSLKDVVFIETETDSFHKSDATPTKSRLMTIDEDGMISGGHYAGRVTLDDDGTRATFVIKATDADRAGHWQTPNTFKGYFMRGVDRTWHDGAHHTITFTTLDTGHENTSDKTDPNDHFTYITDGQFFFGNKR